MRTVIYVLLATAILLAYPLAGQGAAAALPAAGLHETLLSGGDWKLGSFEFGEGERRAAFQASFDDSGFRPAQVPGEVQLQLGLKGMDRYYQSKTLSLVNQKEWWYRKHFVVAKEDAGKLLRLKFEGGDYFVTVWLNGEKLGEHEGGSASFWFDVSSKLKYSNENYLAVKVTCPWVPEGRAFTEYLKGSFGLTIPGSVLKFPTLPYFLGPKWDGVPGYGNAVFPMGLYRDVKLVTSLPEVITDLFVWTKAFNADGSATLRISGKILNARPQETSATLDLEIVPETFSGEPIALPKQFLDLQPGETNFDTEVVAKKAHLWWTWDLGRPDLYKLKAVISPQSAGGTVSREAVFGIRTISRNPDMSYWLNGKRLFLKGAWYPMGDYYGSLPTRQIYEKDLIYYQAANLNHIVNHTVVEKPEFYDLCDRLGILVIVQMPFNQFGPLEVLGPSNPRKDIFVKNALRQVDDIVTEHRNHPSIMEWAPLAEAHEKTGGGWGVGTASFSNYDYDSFVQAIGKLVEKLGGHRGDGHRGWLSRAFQCPDGIRFRVWQRFSARDGKPAEGISAARLVVDRE